MSTQEENTGRLAGLFSGWGVPANWAKFLAGAIIGGLAAIGVISFSGCTALIEKTADGDFHYEGSIISPVIVNEGK